MSNEGDARLRAILETAVEGIITINESGHIVTFNPAAERLFGYASDEVIGKKINILMPEPFRTEHDGYVKSYLETGNRKIIGVGREVRGLRKDGSTFEMYLSVGEFRFENQRFFTGIVRDISEEKRIRLSLERSEARLRAVFDTAVDGIVTIDKSGVITSINPAALRMFGFEAEEVLGRNVRILAPSPFKEEHDSYLSNYLETRDPKVIGTGREVVGCRKDGSTFPMHLTVGEIWVDNEIYFTGVVRDLTEERRVKQRETEVGRILDGSLNEIYIFDAETFKFVQANHGARANIGYSLEELHELTPIDLKPEYDLQSFVDLLAPLRGREQERVVFETYHERKDRSQYSVDVHLQLSHYDGRPAFVAMILDSTERKKTEQRLLQSERLAAIGEMVSGVAHESRNALQRIQVNVEMARMCDPNEESLQHLQKIENAADGLQSLLEEVRNYAAPLHLDLERQCLAAVWRSCWRDLSHLYEQRSVELVDDVEDDASICKVDAFRMDQVFRNLFENSLTACPDPVQIGIVCRKHRGVLEVQVCDNGPGLSVEQQVRVFDAFYTTRQKGTGLGMAITRRIIEAHGGTIATQPSETGARFMICLPIAST